MLVKKENNFYRYVKYLVLLCVFVLATIYRTRVTDFIMNQVHKFSKQDRYLELSLSERDELNILRTENKTLKDENKKLRDEFGIADPEQPKSPVYMLLADSKLYGNFFVTLPKDKTPYKGMNIFSSGNIIVGQVEEIFPGSLKVSKLGQGKTFIAESLENPETIELQSLGTGLYFGNVSGGSKISLGDTIVMKGYPKAIVGTVVEIEKGDASLSNIFVRTPYNVNNKEIYYVTQ